MLRVKLELVPGGDETRARTIGTAELTNVGGTAHLGDYVAQFRDERGEVVMDGSTSLFRRLDQDAWHLLLAVLADARRRRGAGR